MIHWPTLLFIVGYHVVLLACLPIYFLYHGAPSTGLLIYSGAFVFITGLGITAGYHRLMSHLAYRTNQAVEAVLLFFGSMAVQGSALKWCHDHRLHHAHVDTDRDPYSINKGFWYAHILWMFSRSTGIDPKVVSDLQRSPVVRFQHQHYGLCSLVSNAATIVLAGVLFGDWWGALLWAGLVRVFTLHHLTWFINSLAHTWGSQNYSREHSAVDSYILCLLTFGEGYHNYHHTFPQDFRNGVRWYHFDPTKWLIWSLSKLGLAWGLKKVDNVRIARQLMQDHGQRLVEKLQLSFHSQKDLLETKVKEVQEAVVSRLTRLHQLIDESKKNAKQDMGEIIAELKLTKKALKEDWQRWKTIVRCIEKEQSLSLQ
jgi:stearoyl-CoA desaturase (delta-9 desaturase)